MSASQEQDAAVAAAVDKGIFLSKRKKEPKLLRYQTILNAAHQARPVNARASKKSKLRGPATKQAKGNGRAMSSNRKQLSESSADLDLWEERDGPDPSMRPATRETFANCTPPIFMPNQINTVCVSSARIQVVCERLLSRIQVLPCVIHNTWRSHAGPSMIQGVEVDLPGCSFNPEEEQHQDALAEAVAAELGKIYAKEHLPAPNARFNHMPEPDELTALLVSTQATLS